MVESHNLFNTKVTKPSPNKVYQVDHNLYLRFSTINKVSEGDSTPIRPNNMRSGIGGSILIQKFYLK